MLWSLRTTAIDNHHILSWVTPLIIRISPEILNQHPKAGIKITLPSFIVGKEPCVTAATHTAGFTGKKSQT